jgi:hypothetical protein
VVLAEGVAIADVRVLDAVEEHVHAADAEHGVVEVEAVEGLLVEVLLQLGVAQDFRVVVAQVFARGDEEAAGAARGVADDVPGRGGGQFDHELDDVARGAELAVLPGAGDLPEHVLVEVALGVAVLHGDGVDHVHDLGEQGGGGDGEARVLHVVRVGGIVPAQGPEEGEDVLIHDLEHVLGLERCLKRTSGGLRRRGPWNPCRQGRRGVPVSGVSGARPCSPQGCAGRRGA